MSGWLTLPEDLLAAQHCAEVGKHFDTGLLARASDRICELEEELLRLRCAVLLHRGTKSNWTADADEADERLWLSVADFPPGTIKGDG